MTLDLESSDTTVLDDISSDLRSLTAAKLVAGLGIIVWLGFQWGFGNDVVLPTVAARTYNAVEQPPGWSAGISAVVAATLSGGAFWALTQTLDAIIVLSGLRQLPRIHNRISRRLKDKQWIVPYAEMRLTTRWALAYGLGASAVCLIDSLATGKPGLVQRRRMIAQTVALSAGSVAAVIAVVAASIMAAQRHPALEPAATAVARYAASPLTWIVIIATVLIVDRLRRRLRRSGEPTGSTQAGDRPA